MSSRWTPQKHRALRGRVATKISNLVRRVAIALTEGGLWQADGYEDEARADGVEVFQGIGYASRPSATSVSDGSAEAILLHVGGKSGHPVIVATRDESIRVELDEDETAMFNSQAIVKIKSDGTIEASSIGGSPVALATKADLDALEAWATAHTHADPATGYTSTPANIGGPDPAPSASGTSVLKGE